MVYYGGSVRNAEAGRHYESAELLINGLGDGSSHLTGQSSASTKERKEGYYDTEKINDECN